MKLKRAFEGQKQDCRHRGEAALVGTVFLVPRGRRSPFAVKEEDVTSEFFRRQEKLAHRVL